MTSEIRITIADDHPIVRQGLRQVIEREDDLKALAEADDGVVALEQIVELKPEVAVLDVDMPRMDGLEVLRLLRERGLTVAVIILTVHREEAFFNQALQLVLIYLNFQEQRCRKGGNLSVEFLARHIAQQRSRKTCAG